MRTKGDTIFTSKVKYTQEAAAQIERMMAHEGWKRLMEQFVFIRERLISQGKKERAEEGRVYFWAMLDGFDKAVTLAETIVEKEKAKKDLVIDIGED